MKYLLSFIFSANVFFSLAQSNKWLSIIFTKADSVVLISHKDTKGFGIVDSADNRLPNPELFLEKKLNYELVKEYRVLTAKQIDTLINILSRPFEDSIVQRSPCFMPHHTILIYEKKKISFIDVCFWCRWFETSKDFNKLGEFDDLKWAQLESFFKNLGIKYKIDSFTE